MLFQKPSDINFLFEILNVTVKTKRFAFWPLGKIRLHSFERESKRKKHLIQKILNTRDEILLSHNQENIKKHIQI